MKYALESKCILVLFILVLICEMETIHSQIYPPGISVQFALKPTDVSVSIFSIR